MSVEDYEEQLNSKDVAEQRYGMFKVFELVIEDYFSEKVEEPVQRLREEEGYMYKLTQEFLSSSKNYEKRQKLEKLADFVGLQLPDRD